jgi:hypothetical protein
VDLDDLTTEQSDKITDIFFIEHLKEHFNLEDVKVLNSASKLEYKKKLFLKGHFIREIEDNKDINYISFLEQFQDYTGIIPDYNQIPLTQLTFGCKDGLNHNVSSLLHYSLPSTQPKKDNLSITANAVQSCSQGSQDCYNNDEDYTSPLPTDYKNQTNCNNSTKKNSVERKCEAFRKDYSFKSICFKQEIW